MDKNVKFLVSRCITLLVDSKPVQRNCLRFFKNFKKQCALKELISSSDKPAWSLSTTFKSAEIISIVQRNVKMFPWKWLCKNAFQPMFNKTLWTVLANSNPDHCRRTWTKALKSLVLEKHGSWKSWALENMYHEKYLP